MKKNVLYSCLIVLTFVFFQSCHPKMAMLNLMGYYKPARWQTIEDIKKITEIDSAYYDAFYYIDSFKNWQFLSEHQLLTFPGIYLYDKNLNPVKVFNGTNCTHEAMKFISELKETSKKNIVVDTSMRYSANEFLSYTGLIDGNSDFLQNSNPQFDYLFVYTWSSFTPKFTKEVFGTSKKIKNNEKLKIKVISINEDFMATWTQNPEKMEGKKVKLNHLDKYHFISP